MFLESLWAQLPAWASGLWEGLRLPPWVFLPARFPRNGYPRVEWLGLTCHLPKPGWQGTPASSPNYGAEEPPASLWPCGGWVAVLLGEHLCRARGRKEGFQSGGPDSGTLAQACSPEPGTPLGPAATVSCGKLRHRGSGLRRAALGTTRRVLSWQLPRVLRQSSVGTLKPLEDYRSAAGVFPHTV